MNTQRLISSNQIHSQNDALINMVLAKSSREHDTRELARLVDRTRHSRQHHALLVAVLALNEQTTLCQLMNERRHSSASPSTQQRKNSD
jgi:hypothetical protein